jgi:hypothetical protein
METSSPQATQQQDLESPAIFRRGRNVRLVSERTQEQIPSLASTSAADAAVLAARAKALARKEESLQAAIASLHVAFAILGSRALVILSALGSAGLFGWAATQPDGWRLTAAICFTLFVFLPSLYIDRRNGGS